MVWASILGWLRKGWGWLVAGALALAALVAPWVWAIFERKGRKRAEDDRDRAERTAEAMTERADIATDNAASHMQTADQERARRKHTEKQLREARERHTATVEALTAAQPEDVARMLNDLFGDGS